MLPASPACVGAPTFWTLDTWLEFISRRHAPVPPGHHGGDVLPPCRAQVGEIVRTPLGLLGTVLGVKYEDPEAKDSGRLWVRYNNGHEAPLEPRAGAGSINQLGERVG